MIDKITTTKLKEFKQKSQKISVLTGYDYETALILNEAGIDVVLIGDSVGMVKLGYETTLPVTIDDMIRYCKAVKRGNSRALLVADMPFLSYENEIKDAVLNAGRLIKEGEVEAVKIEGGAEMVKTIKKIIEAKIPVMGHIGLTPQAVHQMGGYKVQGKDKDSAKKLVDSAKMLEESGVFALVLECIPADLARTITSNISIPTIGIGAGPHCDGQVLVLDDMLGLCSRVKPKFVKQYVNIRAKILDAVKQYCSEVKEGRFPSDEHTYK
ncbi:MAG: 3-methyl-2-oxobutanoate hydroxymethyltransferase [Endomicrobiales bacterium]|nr:3-methyl-2-oxobutanoate hydroxymethyltransferase [Endomicrobiales bacterium]